MGTSTDAIVAYGFDLAEDGGFDGEELPAWAAEDDDGIDWGECMQRALLVAAGFTELYEDGNDGYFTRERQALSGMGVEIVSHCSCDYPMYILAATHMVAARGCPQPLDLFVPEGADRQLAWAVEVLGVKPVAAQPSWLLASMWC